MELCTGLIRFGVGTNEVLFFKHDKVYVGSIKGEEFNFWLCRKMTIQHVISGSVKPFRGCLILHRCQTF